MVLAVSPAAMTAVGPPCKAGVDATGQVMAPKVGTRWLTLGTRYLVLGVVAVEKLAASSATCRPYEIL